MAEAKKTAAKKPAEKKKEAVKKAVKTAATVKAVKAAATVKAAKTVKKAVEKKLDNIVLEFDGIQIDLASIQKKAANLNGTVYVVLSEKKIYDVEGNSVDLL